MTAALAHQAAFAGVARVPVCPRRADARHHPRLKAVLCRAHDDTPETFRPGSAVELGRPAMLTASFGPRFLLEVFPCVASPARL